MFALTQPGMSYFIIEFIPERHVIHSMFKFQESYSSYHALSWHSWVLWKLCHCIHQLNFQSNGNQYLIFSTVEQGHTSSQNFMGGGCPQIKWKRASRLSTYKNVFLIFCLHCAIFSCGGADNRWIIEKYPPNVLLYVLSRFSKGNLDEINFHETQFKLWTKLVQKRQAEIISLKLNEELVKLV